MGNDASLEHNECYLQKDLTDSDNLDLQKLKILTKKYSNIILLHNQKYINKINDLGDLLMFCMNENLFENINDFLNAKTINIHYVVGFGKNNSSSDDIRALRHIELFVNNKHIHCTTFGSNYYKINKFFKSDMSNTDIMSLPYVCVDDYVDNVNDTLGLIFEIIRILIKYENNNYVPKKYVPSVDAINNILADHCVSKERMFYDVVKGNYNLKAKCKYFDLVIKLISSNFPTIHELENIRITNIKKLELLCDKLESNYQNLLDHTSDEPNNQLNKSLEELKNIMDLKKNELESLKSDSVIKENEQIYTRGIFFNLMCNA